MKHIFKIITVLTLMFSLSACVFSKRPPNLEDRVQATEEKTSYSGIINNLELSIYKDGTHQIETKDGNIPIQSQKINLNKYLNKEVEIFGNMEKLIDNKTSVFIVNKIHLLNAETTNLNAEYTNRHFGFYFIYPDNWDLYEENDAINFKLNSEDVFNIKIFEAYNTLEDFISAHEMEDGTEITISSQKAIRYNTSDEIRIYIENNYNKKVYKLTFHKLKDLNIDENIFYNTIDSFKILNTKVSTDGDICGGEEELTCPDNYFCMLTGNEVDAKGVCVLIDSELDTLDCPFVPKPTNCNSYKAIEFNKDACPTKYICTNEAKNLEIKTNLSYEIINNFKLHQDEILSDLKNIDILEFEYAGEDNILSVIYSFDGTKYKRVFKFEKSADEFNFIKKAEYIEGEVKDWDLWNGDDIKITGSKQIISYKNSKDIANVEAGMRFYKNKNKDFSLQYPSNWYFKNFGPIENTVLTIAFSISPIDDISDANINLVIIEGESEKSTKISSGNYLLSLPRDQNTHFELEGSLEYKEEIDKIANTISY